MECYVYTRKVLQRTKYHQVGVKIAVNLHHFPYRIQNTSTYRTNTRWQYILRTFKPQALPRHQLTRSKLVVKWLPIAQIDKRLSKSLHSGGEYYLW